MAGHTSSTSTIARRHSRVCESLDSKPRLLFAESRSKKAFLVNPQLALGFEGNLDFSVFASFAHHTGKGFDFDIDLVSKNDRKNYWLLGVYTGF